MTALIDPPKCIPATPDKALKAIRAWEREALKQDQVPLQTTHNLHAGIYSRTVRIPAGVVITGTLIKIPTVLTIVGNMQISIGGAVYEIDGLTTFDCAAGRKQVMAARSDCYVTMAFATNAKTVEEAEEEFTDEADMLLSRKEGAHQ